MSEYAKVPVYMSVQDFLFWDPEDDLRYELVDGEPRAMAPANTVHALLQNELGRLIGNHLRDRGTKCDVLANPGVIPQLLSAHNMRVPDLGVTCSPITPPQPAMNDPLLLVEILSPSNQAKTWSNVWAYTTEPSLQEIVVLYTSRISAKILRRDQDGKWPSEPVERSVGDLDLVSLDFSVPLLDLYRRTGLTQPI